MIKITMVLIAISMNSAFAQLPPEPPHGNSGGRGPGGPPPKMNCQAEEQKFCADVERGPKKMDCLISHESESGISDACKQDIARFKEMKENFKKGPPPAYQPPAGSTDDSANGSNIAR